MDNTSIKVRCRTNLDNFKGEEWPTELCCRPLKGDKVISKSGQQLAIVDIIHGREQSSLSSPRLGSENYEPILIVELHKWYSGLGE